MKKIILIIIIALITACNGSTEPELSDKNCKLSRIYNQYSNIDIIYNEDGLIDLINIDSYNTQWKDDYQYEGKRLTKINSGGEEIEVKYEDNKVIIELLATGIDGTQYKMKETSYYENDRLIKREYFNLEENTKSSTEIYNYKNNNLNTILIYDKNDNLIWKTIFHEFDNKNNKLLGIKNNLMLQYFISTNLQIENNPLKEEIIKYTENDTTSEFTYYQYTYNDAGYPITEIQYTPNDTVNLYYDYICE